MNSKKTATDFSRSAIQKVVLKKAVTHPATILPLAAGLGGVFATVLFGSPILLAASAVFVIASGGSFLVNSFVRGKKVADKYLEEQQALLEKQKTKDLPRIKKELVACQKIPGAKKHAGRAVSQFKQLEKTLANINKLLDKTMQNFDVARWRIDIATDELFIKVFGNLKAIVGVLISIESIDLKHIENELARIAVLAKPNEYDTNTKETLLERKKLYLDQLNRVGEILATNEQCITQMEALTTSMAAIDASNESDIDNAILELQSLSAMAASLGENQPEFEVRVKLKNKG